MRKPILHSENQRGQAIVLIAAVMIALVAALGLAIDGGGMFLLYRDVQNATDAAALTAAYALCTGLDLEDNVYSSAKQNGFENGVRGTVTITYPPSSPTVDYVKVEIEAIKPSYFIQVVYTDTLSVTASTTAQCRPDNGFGFPQTAAIVQLQVDGCAGGGSDPLDAIGNNTTAVYGDIFINHSDPACDSVDLNNGSSNFHLDGHMCIQGGNTNIGSPITPPPFSGGTPTVETNCSLDQLTGAAAADPLNLSSNPPTCPTTPNHGSLNDYNGGTAPAGTYNNLNVSPSSSVTMASGTYCVLGDVNVQGDVISAPGGVTIYQDCTGCTIKLNSSAAVDIKAQESGDYKGLLIYSTSQIQSNGHVFNGASGLKMTGTVYTPQAECNISGGNGTVLVAQFICYKLAFTGTSEIEIYHVPSVVYQQPPEFGITE